MPISMATDRRLNPEQAGMSTFSLDEFYQRNRRIVIWVILFALLWLVRDFFGLVFLSYVLAFIATPLVEFGHRRLGFPPLAGAHHGSISCSCCLWWVSFGLSRRMSPARSTA
ncbi:MAG: hypothetical protein H6978_01635 [Gammaproteobacteria bacterium]|nr:hypothetical protein [Gammaproteobacteria bacterium]